MRGNDQLRALLGGRRPKFAINGVLKNDMQMGIRLIEQQHGCLPQVQESQQHQYLQETATGTGNIITGIRSRHFVFGQDVGPTGIRGNQLVTKHLPDGRCQIPPRLFGMVRLHE